MHPDAHIYTDDLGEGVLFYLEQSLSLTRLWKDSFIWCNVTVAHDSKIAENCWIASGSVIAGQSAVGRNTFVGVNATIVDQVKLRF